MKNAHSKEEKLGQTLVQDVKRGKFLSELREEWQDIRDFYLGDEKRDRLLKMSAMKSWFVQSWWVAKAMFLKLTPFRRLMVIAGIILIVWVRVSISEGDGGGRVAFDGAPILGLLALLIVLALELKDKLIARSELEAGRVVQRAMIPPPTPSVPGWNLWLFTRPANEVGGDLVDFMHTTGDRYGVVIGDVAGKGLGAALLMVKIQATLRALAPEYSSLTDLASKLNEILLRDHLPARFVSLVFVRIGESSDTLQYVNAGHMPPLFISDTGVEEFSKGNAALGLSASTPYTEHEHTLRAGERVILYSDGVIESENERGESFGLDRLKALCVSLSRESAQACGERLIAEVEAFIAGAKRIDDISLAVLQRAPQSSS